MKKNNRIWIYSLVMMGLALVFANGCKKDSNSDDSSQNGGLIFNPNLTYGTVTDIDGNVYKTISIGTNLDGREPESNPLPQWRLNI